MMNNTTQNVFTLKRQAYLAAIIAAAFPVVTYSAAARVEFAMAGVRALAVDGTSRPLSKNSELNEGETVLTGDGRVQLRFTDGGYISLQPKTEFLVEGYSFDGKSDGTEKSIFKLLKGGMRAITGAIGKVNKNNYRVNTPIATIGIRGTEFTAQYIEELQNKLQELRVRVGAGAVFLENGGGDLVLFNGQSGVVTNEQTRPQYTDEPPSVSAAGPNGSKPQQKVETGEESQQQEQTGQQADTNLVNQGIAAGLVSCPSDALCRLALNITATSPTSSETPTSPETPTTPTAPVAPTSPTETDATLAAITAYTQQNAIGEYLVVNDVTNVGSISPYESLKLGSTSRFTANFGTSSLNAFMSVVGTSSSSGSSFSDTANFSGSGTINGKNIQFNALSPTGASFNLSSSLAACFYAGCTFTASGSFSGTTAQQAGISYQVKQSGSSIGGGSASFNAPPVTVPGPSE